jgi:3-methyladenine DNA glycosylase AlkD
MTTPLNHNFKTALQVQKHMLSLKNPEKKAILQRFFKTGPGEYGAGDQFIGITVPQTRKLIGQSKELNLEETLKLIKSPWHEIRLFSLLQLIELYKKSNDQKQIFDHYLAHSAYINNWDLVDVSAPYIVGDYLLTRNRSILDRLAKSPLLWDRRIAIIATFKLIRAQQFDDTLRICDKLINDKEDLIHKACGWMLREVGNRDLQTEVNYLNLHYKSMARTQLRYAIEKFPENLRQQYLKGML